MTDFRFAFPHCGQRFRCEAALAGHPVVCPRCGQRFWLPARQAEVPKPQNQPQKPK